MHVLSLFHLPIMLAGLALLLATNLPGNTPIAEAHRGCDDDIEDVRRSVQFGRSFDLEALADAQDCLLGRLGGRVEDRVERIEDRIEDFFDRRGRYPWYYAVPTSNDVVASFDMSGFMCLDFRANGTITSDNDTFDVVSGGYVGFPAFFTAFSYNVIWYLGGFNAWGITLGPWLIQGIKYGSVQTGAAVSGC